MKLTPQQSAQWITQRRSVFPKELEQGIVSLEEMQALLDVARYAPSHKLTQPWRFRVFSDKAKSKLVELQIEALRSEKGDNEDTLAKADKWRRNADSCSFIVAIIMKRDPQERVPVHEEEWAVACAVQNILLHAEALNIGLYWSTGGSTNSSLVRNHLQLSDQDRQMGWLNVGRFEGEKTLVKERMDLSEIAHFES